VESGWGEIEIDTTAGGETVMLVLAVSEPNVAVITVGPTPNVWATPVLEMMETVSGKRDVQVTLRVKSVVLVSE
jgi:hypothetical protein